MFPRGDHLPTPSKSCLSFRWWGAKIGLQGLRLGQEGRRGEERKIRGPQHPCCWVSVRLARGPQASNRRSFRREMFITSQVHFGGLGSDSHGRLTLLHSEKGNIHTPNFKEGTNDEKGQIFCSPLCLLPGVDFPFCTMLALECTLFAKLMIQMFLYGSHLRFCLALDKMHSF